MWIVRGTKIKSLFNKKCARQDKLEALLIL